MFNFNNTQTKYFWIAIVIIGSIGIWLPFLLGDQIEVDDISILITTYYVSIYFSGCLDNVINTIKNKTKDDKSIVKRFLDIMFLILVSIGLIIATILLNQNNYHFIAITLSMIGTVVALILWWRNNRDNETFAEIIRNESNETHGNDW